MHIQFGIQSYQQPAKQLSAQRMVNALLENQEEGAKAPRAILRAPGIETLLTLSSVPVRGWTRHDNKLFVTSGGNLYSVDANHAASTIGTIPGTGRVQMFSNGAQLGIVADQDLYVYETSLAKVTDAGYAGASDATYLDLFGIFVKPNSADFFINNPGAASFPDLTDFDALDFRTAEAGEGDLVAVETDHRELILFKETNGEVWTNTGAADFPFSPVGNAFLELGCIARDSLTKADNTVFWLANDMTVRRLDGYTPVRVSTHAIEDTITKMSVRDDAIAHSHPFNGHLFYVITFPTEKATFVYDITANKWYERETNGNDWRAHYYIYANKTHYMADSLTGKIGKLTAETHTDFDDVHRVLVTSPPIHSEGRWIEFERLEIDFDMGQGGSTDPEVMLRWSDNGGRTWSSEYWRSIGKVGEYEKRAVWHNLGRSRDRVFELAYTDTSPFTLIEAFADVSIGGT